MFVSEKRKKSNEDFSQEFIEDHREISHLVNNLLEKRNKPLAKEFVQKLNWYLERHIYIEEKAFFTLLKSEPDVDLDIDGLIRDHNEILTLKEQLKDCIQSCENQVGTRLKESLDAHFKFEKENL